MNLKRIVTVIVAGLALFLIMTLPCEAAATTKATTNVTMNNQLKKSAVVIAKKAEKKVKKKQAKKNKSKKKSYTESELRYMTTIIYCEARGESYQGKKAVGIVVMNRVRSDKFPDSVKEVIYQRGQFSPVSNGSLSRALNSYDSQKEKGKIKGTMKTCMKAAKEVLNGSTTVEVNGKKKQMKDYLFFSRYVSGAKFQLGGHQFK